MKSLVLASMPFLLLIGTAVFGQGYTFKVLANKGVNEVKSGGGWKSLRTGASLKEGDELKISNNAYLGLVHNSGKTLELKKAGNHKVNELASRINTGVPGVAGKYADFVLSKMSAQGKSNRLSATGAVHRAAVNARINIYMPKSVEVFNYVALIQWGAVDGVKIYEVTVVNMFDDELLKIQTADSNFKLDLKDEKLINAVALLVTIGVKGEEDMKSEEVAIKRLPEDKAVLVKQNLNELMGEINTETALNNYILAGFYEESKLLLDALFYYQEAKRLAPSVASYNEAYEEFLFRNRLNQ